MKGIIIVNPFLVPKESTYFAERLKTEFISLGVDVEVISDSFLRTTLDNGKICTDLKCDFAVYLDKDKYQSALLARTGVRLFNSHDAIRACDDKAITYIALSMSNLNLPKTIFGGLCYRNDLAVNKRWADDIGSQLGYPVIVKESFGSMGKGVYKADTPADLIAIMKHVKLKPHLFQEYLPHGLCL